MTQSPVASDEAAMLAMVAADSAAAVGPELRSAFRSTMDVEFKRDVHDPVTEHDRRAELRIRELIREKVPDSTIIGEEAEPEGDGRVHWYLDPIDGTANFARGIAFFCTSIGVAIDGRMVAAAINDPMAGLLFTATPSGAWCNGKEIRSRGAQTESAATINVGYPHPRSIAAGRERALDHAASLITSYGTFRRIGSAALTLAHVAAGWLDAGLGTGVHPWDVSAGSLLVTAAGGRYEPIWPAGSGGGPDFLAPGYCATVPELEPEVLGTIVEELRATPEH